MRPIKSRTYYNFKRVMKMIEAKGHSKDVAEGITRQIFDEYEANPKGLSVLARVDMIRNADE